MLNTAQHNYEPEGVLTEDFTMDEVRQALGSLKQRAAPGRDGLTAEMISREGLVEFWWVLFNWSWRNGMVPSEWRRGVMVPVPKKKSRGTDACTLDDFRGISVVSAAYKAMCKIVQVHLEFVERQQLLAEEQGGFRKGRGCRDQMVTLHLLGQIRMITKKKGMFASFIDLSKAYDRVDRTKLWRCLVEKGLSGRMIDFLKAAYLGIRCEVKVGDEFSDLFEVTTGLRQGCILSPLLFSLYINSFVDCLKEAGVGVEYKYCTKRYSCMVQKCGEVVEYWSRWSRCRCERHGYSWGWEDFTPGCPCSLRCRWSR